MLEEAVAVHRRKRSTLADVPRDLNRLSLDELFAVLLPTPLLRRECRRFLEEDVGCGDVTSRAMISADRRGSARIVAREPCVLAGMDAAAYLATMGRRDLLLAEQARDGSRLRSGAVVAVIEGRVRDLLEVERCVLNLLGHLSGIATLTAAFVDRIRRTRGARAHLFDTRKTTPGLRLFEKYAVRAGGGRLHRLRLDDAVLVKDNHLAALGGDALDGARRRLVALGSKRRRLRFVEVEVDRLDQLAEILRWPKGLVDVVLLDNMTPRDLRRAVSMRDRASSKVELEASGGVRLGRVATIARTGVDRISAGAVTHAARSIDFSMEFDAVVGMGVASPPTRAVRRPRSRQR